MKLHNKLYVFLKYVVVQIILKSDIHKTRSSLEVIVVDTAAKGIV